MKESSQLMIADRLDLVLILVRLLGILMGSIPLGDGLVLERTSPSFFGLPLATWRPFQDSLRFHGHSNHSIAVEDKRARG